MYGYQGRYLRVDASQGRAALIPLPEEVLRGFIGGVGLASWILGRETHGPVDPLGEWAVLVIGLSPLVGTPLTTSAKFAVVAYSPLTGRLCDALSSSHFALAAKRAGVDAIALTGRREALSLLFIDGSTPGAPTIGWEDADSLAGKSAAESEALIRGQYGHDWQVAAIGQAGEARVPLATISHDGRHAGRGGLGAILGDKRIKAIAVRGSQRTSLAHPERTVELAKRLSEQSFGPATEKYRELGTVANLLVFNRLNMLPTRNFTAGRFTEVEKLAAVELGPSRRIARHSCASCTIGCEHIYERPRGEGGVRLEYESLYALGPGCGVSDPERVLEAAAACDESGLDTISLGGTLAFLMECAERGLLEETTLPSGRPLAFGDGGAVVEAVWATAQRRGIGALAALGTREAARRIGGEAPELAMHVKGLELPGYDPRVLPTMALGLAVGTRGADHNRSGAYEADLSGGMSHAIDSEAIARAAIETENRAALIDSLILCKFLRGVFSDLHAEAAELLQAVTGWDLDRGEMVQISQRVINARKCLNERAGWRCAEDGLPNRLLTPPARLDPAQLQAMIQAYYRQRGWDEEGRVPRSLRISLGLDTTGFGG